MNPDVEVGASPTVVICGAPHSGRAAGFFRQAAGPVGPAARLAPSPDGRWGAFRAGILNRGGTEVVVAQRLEHQAHNLGVTGSTPVHNTPRSAEDRLLRDARNVSTNGPEGNGRLRRSALVRTEASRAARKPDECNANGRPEARGFRRPTPTAIGTQTWRKSWGFGLMLVPADVNLIPSDGPAQARLRVLKRDRRTIRSPKAFCIREFPLLTLFRMHDP